MITSSIERLDAYLKILGRLEHEGSRPSMEQLIRGCEIGSEILVQTSEAFCDICNRIYGADCDKKRHFDWSKTECGSLAPNWKDILREEIRRELKGQGYLLDADGVTFTKQGLRIGIEPFVGEFYRKDLNSVFGTASRIAHWDACLVLGGEKSDDVKTVENYYSEVYFCRFEDFSDPQFRHKTLLYLEGLARTNRCIMRQQEMAGTISLEKVRPAEEAPLEEIIQATLEIIEEIERRGKSDLELGNVYEKLIKQLCGDLFFQYTIRERGNLPDFLVFLPASLRYFIVDAKSGVLNIKERRKVKDYALTQKNLKAGDLDLSMSGLLILARASSQKKATEFCTKTRVGLLENRRMPKDIVVSWLSPEGLIELAQSVQKDINQKFFVNLFLKDVLNQGYMGKTEIEEALKSLEEERIMGHSNRDIILQALKENVSYYD
ncbi:MAG: hypothetical protein KAR39_06765 [Thermoplasmata archaeon]|nr:hypothetical protein [Thermoplasmata archaeon]